MPCGNVDYGEYVVQLPQSGQHYQLLMGQAHYQQMVHGEIICSLSKAIGELGKINGPRCCKRDAMIAFKNGIEYINSNYDVVLEYEHIRCEYSKRNEQCIKERCPYYE